MSLRFARRTSFIVAVVAIVAAAQASTAATPQELCLRGRYSARAKYLGCDQKALASLASGKLDFTGFQGAVSKCRLKYAAAWPKLQQYTGTFCANPRFDDNGDGTVTDRLTGLQWEQKTDDGSVHDKDNVHAWSTGLVGYADGSTFTTFLSALDGGGCFAGNCDWRLPTLDELQTILLPEAYPCATNPCIDQAVFGPVTLDDFVSASTDATDPEDPESIYSAWDVLFAQGHVYSNGKNHNTVVRAVRAGL